MATCGTSELDFAVVSRSLAELIDEVQLLEGAGRPDEAPTSDGARAHGCAVAPGVEHDLLVFLEGDPWEGCDDVAEWGFAEWCVDVARLKSSDIDEDPTSLLALFLADGDTDGGSTRPNALAELSNRPSMESTGTAAWLFPTDTASPGSCPASGPCSSKSLQEPMPSTRAPSPDSHPCPEPMRQEGSESAWVPKHDLGSDWELSFLLRSVADM